MVVGAEQFVNGDGLVAVRAGPAEAVRVQGRLQSAHHCWPR